MPLAVGESYVTVELADAYHSKSFTGSDWAGIEVSRKEMLLRAATNKMQEAIEWEGSPTSESQPLAWPRTGLKTRNGADLPGDSIPDEIMNACAEFALRLDTESYDDDPGIIDLDIRSTKTSSYGPNPVRRRIAAAAEAMIPTDWVKSIAGSKEGSFRREPQNAW